MKKLFENWRKFREDILTELTPDIIDYSPELHTRKTLSSKLTKKEYEYILQIVSLIDPTGVTSYPDVAAALKNLNLDDPDAPTTLAAVGAFLLAAVSAIPFVGKAASPAKAAKLTTASKTIKSGTKILDQVSGSKKIISQIAKKHEENLKRLLKSAGKPLIPEKLLEFHKTWINLKSKIKTVIISANNVPAGVTSASVRALSDIPNTLKQLTNQLKGPGDIIVYRGIRGDKFSLTDMPDEAWDLLTKMDRKKWDFIDPKVKMNKSAEELFEDLSMDMHLAIRGGGPQYFSDVAQDVIGSYAGDLKRIKGKIPQSTIVAIKIDKQELFNYISYAGSFTNVSKVKGGAYAIPPDLIIDAMNKKNMAVLHINPINH